MSWFAFQSQAIELSYQITQCGDYVAYGLAEKRQEEFVLIFFNQSKSEHVFKIHDESRIRLLPYLNRQVKTVIEVNKLPQYRQTIVSIKEIEDSSIEKLKTEDRHGFKLIKMKKCIKE